jgi:hypothetical protein
MLCIFSNVNDVIGVNKMGDIGVHWNEQLVLSDGFFLSGVEPTVYNSRYLFGLSYK